MRLSKFVWIFALFPALVFGQNVRWDLPVTTTQAQGGNLLPVYAVPGARVSFYNEPGGTLASTYNSATSVSPCPSNAQVVLNGSAVCVSSADPFGNMGAWFQPGQYMARITALGSSYNYYFTIASGGGGSGTVTSVSGVTANGFAPTVSNPTTTPAITVNVDGTHVLPVNTGSSANCLTQAGTYAPCGSNPLTTKGDVFGFSTVPARIPVGTDGYCFVADSTQTLGVKWGVCPNFAVSGQAAGTVPLATGANTIGAQSHITDNGTAVTVSEPTTFSGSGPPISIPANKATSPLTGTAQLGTDSSGNLVLSENNGAQGRIRCTATAHAFQYNNGGNIDCAAPFTYDPGTGLNSFSPANINWSTTTGTNSLLTIGPPGDVDVEARYQLLDDVTSFIYPGANTSFETATYINKTVNDPSNSIVVGHENFMSISDAVSHASTTFIANHSEGGAFGSSGNILTFGGVLGAVRNQSSGTIGTLYGLSGEADTETGTTTNQYAIWAMTPNTAITMGTTTNNVGVKISSQDSVPGAVNTYALVSDSTVAPAVFNGPLKANSGSGVSPVCTSADPCGGGSSNPTTCTANSTGNKCLGVSPYVAVSGDWTTAIRQAVTDLDGEGGGTLFIPCSSTEYNVHGSKLDPGGANAVIPMPANPLSVGTTKRIRFKGLCAPNVYYQSVAATLNADVSVGNFIGGYVVSGPYGGFINTDFELDSVEIHNAQVNPGAVMVNATFFPSSTINDVVIRSDASGTPTTTTGAGYYSPALSNNVYLSVDHMAVVGFYALARFGEHSHIGHIAGANSHLGWVFDAEPGTDPSHSTWGNSVSVDYLWCQLCDYEISAGVAQATINVQAADFEVAVTAAINDPSNLLTGDVYYNVPYTDGRSTSTIYNAVKNGGTNLRLHNLKYPGVAFDDGTGANGSGGSTGAINWRASSFTPNISLTTVNGLVTSNGGSVGVSTADSSSNFANFFVTTSNEPAVSATFTTCATTTCYQAHNIGAYPNWMNLITIPSTATGLGAPFTPSSSIIRSDTGLTAGLNIDAGATGAPVNIMTQDIARFTVASTGVTLPNGEVYGIGASATPDTGLSRDTSEGAGVIDVGNGTAGDASGKLKAAAIADSTLTSGNCVQATTGGLLANGPGFCALGLSIPLGTATFTPGTGVTSAGCASGYTCTNTRGEIALVGGTATTGTIVTVNFSAGLSAAPFCSIFLNGSGSTGTAGFDLGHGTPGTTNFTITAGLSVIGATLNIDYQCQP